MVKAMNKIYKFILLFGWFCSIFLFLINFNMLSLFVSLFLIIFNFVFLKEKKIIIISVIFFLCCIIVNSITLYKNYNDSIDKLEDYNILLGSWLYNDIGGTYVFNEDHTFYQYVFSNTLDNYCYGEYSYKYGGNYNNDIIYKDDTYYYYTLKLDTDYCVINGNTDNNIKDSEFVFAVNIDDYNDIMFMDINENSTFKITKID